MFSNHTFLISVTAKQADIGRWLSKIDSISTNFIRVANLIGSHTLSHFLGKRVVVHSIPADIRSVTWRVSKDTLQVVAEASGWCPVEEPQPPSDQESVSDTDASGDDNGVPIGDKVINFVYEWAVKSVGKGAQGWCEVYQYKPPC